MIAFLPGIRHPDFGDCLLYGLLPAGQADRLLKQPGGNALALGDKGALTPLEDGEHLFHVGMK